VRLHRHFHHGGRVCRYLGGNNCQLLQASQPFQLMKQSKTAVSSGKKRVNSPADEDQDNQSDEYCQFLIGKPRGDYTLKPFRQFIHSVGQIHTFLPQARREVRMPVIPSLRYCHSYRLQPVIYDRRESIPFFPFWALPCMVVMTLTLLST